MGHYTAHAFRLRLKPETPEEILGVLRDLIKEYGDEEPSFNNAVVSPSDVEIFSELYGMMHGHTSSFWHWNHRSLKQDENGVWEFLTYASSKYLNHDAVMALLSTVAPFMIFKHGDIFYRELFEMQTAERIAYYDEPANMFMMREGYTYSLPGEYLDPLDCPDHGWTDPEPGPDEELEPFNPPWNVVELQQELQERIDQKRQKRAKKQAREIKVRRR